MLATLTCGAWPRTAAAGRLVGRGASARQALAACRPAAPRRQRGRTCSASKDELGDLDQQLLQDLERLRQRSAAQQQQAQQPGAGGPPRVAAPGGGSGGAADAKEGGGLKDLIDKFLIADFFFILFALAWFAVGLAQRSATQSTAVLDAWYGLWQWVFQPAIGVLMLGAIVSGLFDWAQDNLGRK